MSHRICRRSRSILKSRQCWSVCLPSHHTTAIRTPVRCSVFWAKRPGSRCRWKQVQSARAFSRLRGSPVVVILEDLHWADDESLALLARLSPLVTERPVLLLSSYRDDERPTLPKDLPQIQVMSLDRLTQAGIVELTGSMLGAAGRQPRLIELLQRETEGNVFFLVEVVRALAEEAGQLGNVGLRDLPERVSAGGVRQIVQRRLNRVPA